MACRVATAALEVLRDEDMAGNATRMGERLREGLRSLDAPGVELVRGRGLLNAVVVKVWHPEIHERQIVEWGEGGGGRERGRRDGLLEATRGRGMRTLACRTRHKSQKFVAFMKFL